MLVSPVVKEVSEATTFCSFYTSQFGDLNHSLKKVLLSVDVMGSNSIETELQHPVSVALTM